MKLPLRITLTSLFVTVIVLTVAALGYNAYCHARVSADLLATRTLNQTSQLVDAHVNELLHVALDQNRINTRLLTTEPDSLLPFVYSLAVMQGQPRLARIAVGLEASGELQYFQRQAHDKKITFGIASGMEPDGRFRLWTAPAEGNSLGLIGGTPDRLIRDPRTQPWYTAARKARRQTWTETHDFFGAEGDTHVPGVTCSTPIYRPDGSFHGVLGASIDLAELSSHLQSLHVGEHGYAFIVEFRVDGTQRVIAHPRPELLLRKVEEQGQPRWALVPPAELEDPHIAAFLRRLPPGLAPAGLSGMKRLRFTDRGTPYLGAYRCLSSRATPNWLVCIVMPEADVLEEVEESKQEAVWIGLSILLGATLVSLYVSRQVARPLERLVKETESIGRLEVEAHPVAHSVVQEVDRLALAVEGTKTSLRSFRKYVPADLVRGLLASGQEAMPGGERRSVTIWFCDLANFTTVSEQLPPEQLVRHLSEYFTAFSSGILASGGTVDKYIGDAIMAFWGAPAATPDHARAACLTALRCQAALETLRARWEAEGKPLLSARIGLHTGEGVVGNIGTDARLNYTVMGDSVNLASRLEGLNKYYGTEILISEQTVREAGPGFLARPVDWVSVQGRAEPVQVYELLGLEEDAGPGERKRVELSSQALALYRRRKWETAIRVFEHLLELDPEDGPARVMAERCHTYQTQPPPEAWDGVYRMESK